MNMANKSFTTKSINIAVLGNRILNNVTAATKAEITKDNLIFESIYKIIDKIAKVSQENEKKRFEISQDTTLDIKQKQAQFDKIKEELKKQHDVEATVILEQGLFSYLKECFDKGIDAIIAQDLKQEDPDKKILNNNFKRAIVEIEEAFDNAKTITK